MQPLQYNFWLVVWNIFYFSIYWEGSSQLTNIFRGVETTNQIYAVQLRKNIGKTTPELSVPLRPSETELLNTMELRARTSAKPRPNCQFHCRADPGMIPVQTNVFRNRPPDKLPHPYSEMFCPAKHSISCICYLSKRHFVRDFPEKLKAEDVKTKRARETSHKT